MITKINKFQILKQLLPGFIPLIIYIIADSMFGELWGMVIAAAVSIIEFILIKILQKITDKFVLFDLLLVAIFGSISIISRNSEFFMLKPAIVEIIMALIIAIAVFVKTSLLEKFIHRYLPNTQLNAFQLTQMKKSATSLFWLICVHIVAIIYSVYFLPKPVWAFISSIGLYILFGLWFIFELISKKRKQYILQNEEWLDIVDSKGTKIGEATRSVCHSNPSLIHQVIHLHIINNRGELLLQKRNMQRQIQPGKWDTSVGGHLLKGESVQTALFREAKEELNLNDFQPKFVARYLWKSPVETELVNTFVAFCDFEPAIDLSEIDEARFWNFKDIELNLGKEIFTPNFEEEFKNILLALKKNNQ